MAPNAFLQQIDRRQSDQDEADLSEEPLSLELPTYIQAFGSGYSDSSFIQTPHASYQNRHEHVTDSNIAHQGSRPERLIPTPELCTPSPHSSQGLEVLSFQSPVQQQLIESTCYASHLPTAESYDRGSQKCSTPLFVSSDEEESSSKSEGNLQRLPDIDLVDTNTHLHARTNEHRVFRLNSNQDSSIFQGEPVSTNKLPFRRPRNRPAKRTPETDPVNHAIKRMRTENLMSWAEIVQALNENSIAAGSSIRYTEAAVYSRFKRNAPRVALASGDANFDPAVWMHLRQNTNGTRMTRKPHGSINDPLQCFTSRTTAEWTSEDDYNLMSIHHQAMNALWGGVASALNVSAGKHFTPQQCKQRLNELSS